MTNFLKYELLKSSVGLTGVQSHDLKLREITAESNQEVDAQLKPYAESIPLDTGSVIFGQIQKTALHYGRMIWFNHIKQHDLEEKEKTNYEAKLKSIKDSLAADRNIRGVAVLISSDPREEKLPIPSQYDTFLLDRF